MKRTVFGALLIFSCASLFAQSTRTFVSGNGLDSNPCTVTQPCRSIPVALGATAGGGEIIVLDSAGYGQSITINKSVNIVVPAGIFAAMTPSTAGLSATAIYISAAATDTIRIDGLEILGAGPANNQVGVNIGSAGGGTGAGKVELANMNIKSVAYPIKVLYDAHVLIKNVEATIFTTGIVMSGGNTNPDTSTLKVWAIGSTFIFGVLGVQADTGAIIMQGNQAGINANRIAFMTSGVYNFGAASAGCSQVVTEYFNGSSNTSSTVAGNSVCSAP